MSKWLSLSEAERHTAFLSRDFSAPCVTQKQKPLGIKPTESQLWYRNVYLRSEHWQALRRAKLRQCPRCYMCNSRQHIDVHHLSYANLGHEILPELMTLCRTCHQIEHGTMSEVEKIAIELEIMKRAEALKIFWRNFRRSKAWKNRKLRNHFRRQAVKLMRRRSQNHPSQN
jgi:hypothetical protein